MLRKNHIANILVVCYFRELHKSVIHAKLLAFGYSLDEHVLTVVVGHNKL